MKLTRRQLLGSAAALTAAAAASRLGHQYLHRLPPVRIHRIGLPFGHELRNGQVSLAPQSEHRCHTLILGSGAASSSLKASSATATMPPMFQVAFLPPPARTI